MNVMADMREETHVVDKITRRRLLQVGALAGGIGATHTMAGAATLGSEIRGQLTRPSLSPGGLCLNEDSSHYFFTRAGQQLNRDKVDAWVDQYANTQVRELMLNVNCQRTSYASQVWNPIWKGYDPQGPDDQELLASVSGEARGNARKWIHTAWQLHQAGIDVYARWIDRCRQKKISPWVSLRMNDLHYVNDEHAYIHSDFWRSHPQWRRVSYRFSDWTDKALDYERPEVRDYSMKLVREVLERYDFDGLELDWMRFGYYFRPGHESDGAVILTEFTAAVRSLLNEWEKKRGHPIRLGARVPSQPQTALGLGMDAVTWAKRGLLDMLVITPFLYAQTDLPIELWKELLHGTNVTLAAGLELTLRPYSDSPERDTNSLETARGAAASFLDRGADRVYLFNFMDSQTSMDDLRNYPTLLREIGQLATLSGKARRHVLTYTDTTAPGEVRAMPLPATYTAGQWNAFRLAIGPKPTGGRAQVRLGIDGSSEEEVKSWEVRVNGERCVFEGVTHLEKPKSDKPTFGFGVPFSLLNRGNNLVELAPKGQGRIVWVEIALVS
jgi:hypothetical protein